MLLKSVEMFGFKSFADRTKIEFRDGISALLGPNGCGKSNVVDAIKWVLGEQNSRSLRADHMEDVIFNGTEARKALNIAEVTITLTNDETNLPMDFPEISIKRRIYRSGESEYSINNTPVKLRDIRELFYDTGIGKSAYSIMEQGRIDQILSNKPEERRYVFEEAAGITKFKIKGLEAERKLEKTEENMRQADSILQEVKRNHDSLKVQAEKAVQYRNLRDGIFEIETDLHLLRLRSFMEEKHARNRDFLDKSNQRDVIKQEIDTINVSMEEFMDSVNTMEEALVELQKNIYAAEMSRMNKTEQIKMLQERIKEIEVQITFAQNRAQVLEDKAQALSKELEDKIFLLEQFKRRIDEIEENIDSFEENIDHAIERIQHNETEIERCDKEAQRLDSLQDDLQAELQLLTDNIVDQLDSRLRDSGYTYNNRQVIEEELGACLHSLEVIFQGKKKYFQDGLGFSDLATAKKYFETGTSGLDEISTVLARLEEIISRYKQIIPSFLDEFLAPEGTITRKRQIDGELQRARQSSLEKRATAERLREENKNLTVKIDEYRKTLEDLRVNRIQMITQNTSVEESISRLELELAEQERQIYENNREITLNHERINEIGQRVEDVKKEINQLDQDEQRFKKELENVESGIAKRNTDLATKQRVLKEKMDLLGTVQAKVEKLSGDMAGVETEIRNIYENFRERFSRDLAEFEDRMYEIKGTASDLRDTLNFLKEDQKKLGTVNLMAPEEFQEVKERFDFLKTQLDDLQKARDDLKEVTDGIKKESTDLFLRTYEQIKKNFHNTFRRLFGGGRAELRLTEGLEVLDAGIEIFAQPPGKKLENIALLSGGEKTLTAIALLFATYLVKPSPFCILDEIDAALDESNVLRFVNLLMEFGNTSQFIVITHNKKTVTGAKTLLGVTMEESGVSKAIAIRLDEITAQKGESGTIPQQLGKTYELALQEPEE